MTHETSLRGKVALVTGGSGGIGRFVAAGLAERGATVIIVGRDEARGRSAVATMAQATGNAHFFRADLSLLSEVRRLTLHLLTNYSRLDLLVHSAGFVAAQRRLTAEGHEINWVTNYLSRFLLTNLLLERLQESAPARVVNIAAPGVSGSIDFGDLAGERKIGGLKGLTQAQFANDVFTVELARRLHGTGVTATAVNPGLVDTDIRCDFPPLVRGLMWLAFRPFLHQPEKAAEAPLQLATAPEYERANGGLFKQTKQITPSQAVQDRSLGQQLWEVSSQLCQVDLAIA